ncbi:MAG: phosphotransferase [Pseudomonadota bacterium]
MKAPSIDIAQSTPTGGAIARMVMAHYALGDLADCVLMRRGFNHVYELRFTDGRRAVARLCAERPRGAPNTAYETALLRHLKAAGAGVAAPLAARDGAASIAMPLPEGPRDLVLFEYLEGEGPGESVPDTEATGRGLALLHELAQGYAGPPSRYQLDLQHLLHAPLALLCAAPTMDDALRAGYMALAGRLAERIGALLPTLSRVACHGDCHGGNNFVTDGPDGVRVASFFDFDDTGPGLLAYELCVYLWNTLPRKVGGVLDEAGLTRWQRFVAGYRSVRPLAKVDFDAITAFVPVRQIWLMGEFAGRIPVLGTQAMPSVYLRKQLEIMAYWESVKTPE